jgi:hypothetical protein
LIITLAVSNIYLPSMFRKWHIFTTFAGVARQHNCPRWIRRHLGWQMTSHAHGLLLPSLTSHRKYPPPPAPWHRRDPGGRWARRCECCPQEGGGEGGWVDSDGARLVPPERMQRRERSPTGAGGSDNGRWGGAPPRAMTHLSVAGHRRVRLHHGRELRSPTLSPAGRGSNASTWLSCTWKLWTTACSRTSSLPPVHGPKAHEAEDKQNYHPDTDANHNP